MPRQIAVFTAAALLFCSAAAFAQTPPDTACGPDAKGTPETRIAACTAIIEAKPEPKALAAAYRGRAEILRRAGQFDRAILDANEAVRLDPGNAQAFGTRGNAFLGKGSYDRALEDFNEAVRLDPNFAQAFSDRGVAFYLKGDHERAIYSYNEAIRLDGERSSFYANRGAAFAKLGQNDKAIADDSKAISLDPSVPEFYDNRGLGYARNGDYDRAITDYDEAIRIRPKANFLTNRGDSFQHKGDYEHAIADYDAALKLDPSFSLAWNNRGAAWASKGDIDRAIADYEQAVRINPRNSTAVENLTALRRKRDGLAMVDSGMNPSFDCASASLSVEKAICSDAELARLDRDVDSAYQAALGRLPAKRAEALRREQRSFIATRNRLFGRTDYQFRKEMERRLAQLRAMQP
jgi:tetratricopeptide (TPR) repeat protein